MMPEEGKTDSESSCSFFGKRKAVTRKNELRLQKIRFETLWRGCTLSSEMFFETPSAGAPPFFVSVFEILREQGYGARLRMTKTN